MAKFLLLCSVFLLNLAPAAQACTAFAAAGDAVENRDGTLIAKVRDEVYKGQEFRTVRPESGYAYTGLFAGPKKRFNMGVNEKGLVVFRTTAGSVPKSERLKIKAFRSSDGLQGQEFLIRHCATVEEALRHPEVFTGPTNYMLADRKEIAFVEVFPDGTYKVEKTADGVLRHTNHYITEEGEKFNVSIGKSSKTRFERISELIKDEPLNMEKFISFTEDRNAGPNNSIFRTGDGTEKRSRTLAALVVHLPKKGEPVMYLRWLEKHDGKEIWKEVGEKVNLAQKPSHDAKKTHPN